VSHPTEPAAPDVVASPADDDAPDVAASPAADDARDVTASPAADDSPGGQQHPAGLVVAIDGPAGVGKSTVAARTADALGIPHLDTGALYRAATLACLRAGVDLVDGDACAEIVAKAVIRRAANRTELDGEDVEEEIRGAAVTAAVSIVSAHGGVRAALLPAQRQAVAPAGGVMEGRDIGSVVLPHADLKVYLTASIEERARRRGGQVGRDDLDVIASEIATRDAIDGGREVSPLQQADDAWVLDTTDWDVDDVVAMVTARAREIAHEHAIPIGAGADDVDVEDGADGGRAGALGTPSDPLGVRRSLPRVAVVGRPNVGKSTLVNRILGARVTIVEEKPGVTRDRTEHLADWLGRTFLVVDTGGWEHAAEGMSARIVAQAEAAVAAADLVLFVVDGTTGALEDDERYARLLRRSGTPTLLVANKIDGDRQEPLVHELYSLGLGVPYPVSARHGRGVGDLLDEVLDRLPDVPEVELDESSVPHVAIVGRPNAGKSSLFNRLLGEERSIVDPVPHTTRDAVDTMIEIDGEPWVFVDTAGMRRRYRHGEDTELYSVDRTRAAIAQADLVLFVIDASEPLGEQDQRLAALLRDAGRGLVLVCNKWDLVDEDRRGELEKELDRLLSFASWAPRINISALTGRGLRRVLPTLRTVHGNYQRRVPTRALNQLVEEAVARHAPPRAGQKQLKIRYATQAEVAPPRFVLFANGRLPDGYLRYLERELRERYDFTGVPLLVDDRRRQRTPRGRRDDRAQRG
jgi:GTPase